MFKMVTPNVFVRFEPYIKYIDSFVELSAYVNWLHLVLVWGTNNRLQSIMKNSKKHFKVR